MKIYNKLILLELLFISFPIFLFSQVPSGYYDGTNGLEGNALRQALHNIIDGHTTISYDDLWDAYEDTDRRSDGKVWDIYSTCNFTFGSDQCGNYQNICDCYNREHTVPKSWFNNASPMKSDLFHVLPTDGKVNGYRSNYPYGECNSGTTYGTGKKGSCSYPGYSGTVFEPADEYKGDVARIYFYMATRYMDVINNWSGESFNGNNFSNWTRNMLLEWHHEDPVSQKEIDRNNAAYNYQHNRNPFVDNPNFADAIWDPNYTPSYINMTEAYFEVYPNPVKDILNIKNNTTSEFIEITIKDISGRVILKNNNNLSFDISAYKSGIYFLVIKDSKGEYYVKKINKL